MSLVDKLTTYYPGAQWTLNGETYEGLTWIGPGDKPTEQDLDALQWPPEPSTDPTDYPLLPWQFTALVNYLGVDGAIRSAISQIPDAMTAAAALARYEKSTTYRYSDPLVAQLRQAIGLSEQALADAWMLAKDLRSS